MDINEIKEKENIDCTKKRIPFTEVERNYLVKLIKQFPVIENKVTNAANIEKKKKSWIALALKYNAQSFTSSRSEFQLKRCWENMKSARKKELAIERNSISKTGGGPPTSPPTQNLIDAACPHIDLCVPGVIDSDHLPNQEKSVTTDMVIVSDSDIPLESEDIIIENIHDDKICDYNNHDLHSSNVKTAQNVIYQPQKKGNVIQKSEQAKPNKKLKQIHTECEARVERLLQNMEQERELHLVRLERERVMLEKEKNLLLKAQEELEFQRSLHKSNNNI